MSIRSLILSLALYLFSITGKAQVVPTADLVNPLPVGATIPKVNLLDLDNKHVSTNDLLKNPTVLVFYRGGWCPYCNKQLSGLLQVEKDIIAKGYQIVAVSPDAPEQLKATLDKNQLTYKLFSDKDGTFIKSMGLAFTAPERYSDRLLQYSAGANTDRILPVPAVYLINTKGKVLYMYADADYTKRLDEKILMDELNKL